MPLEPGCLALIVAAADCRRPDPRLALEPEPDMPPAAVGRVVRVLGPALYPCGCCVSVLPTWWDAPDPRGYACRRSNLMRLDGGAALETPRSTEAQR